MKLDANAERLLAELLEIIELSTPLRWATAEVTVWATILTSTWTMSAVNTDGTRTSRAPQKAFDRKVEEFRAACYVPGRGTWYSATFALTNGGEPDVRLRYDENPEWRSAWPHPHSYVRDLEFFPRDDEHIPGWLREQLDWKENP